MDQGYKGMDGGDGAADVTVLGRQCVGGGARRDFGSLWGFYRVYIFDTVAGCKSSVKT